MRRHFLLCLALLLGWLWTDAVQGAATNYTVKITTESTRFVFSPTNLSLAPGDSITWTNAHLTATHDTTSGITNSSPPFLWHSTNLSAGGATFNFTFTNAGVYPYRCMRHADNPPAIGQTYHPEQTGAVLVVSGNLPPTVSLSNPATGSTFLAPATFPLQAAATDDVAVVSVQFFNGAAPLGTVSVAPFNLTLTNVVAGTYSFTAVASDGSLLATSAPVSVFVLTNAQFLQPLFTNGVALLTLTGIAGQTYFIDATTNIPNWSPISTNVAPSNVFTIADTNALPRRFYRARQVTSP